jgi:hypothetical protein
MTEGSMEQSNMLPYFQFTIVGPFTHFQRLFLALVNKLHSIGAKHPHARQPHVNVQLERHAQATFETAIYQAC